MDDEDFLAAIEADNANAPVEEPKPAEEAPKEPEPKQEPKEPEPAPDAATLSEPATPKEPTVPNELTPKEAPHAPLTALLDEREKRQKAEAELERYRQAQAQAQAQAQVPDPDEDPDAYRSWQEGRLQSLLINQTLNTSERFARKEYGVETVDQAKTWALERFSRDPLYQQQVFADPDPYEKVVADYRKEQLFTKVSDPSEYDAFLAWKQAQGQLEQQAQPNGAAPPNPTPAIPPRSLAGAPSAGGINAQVELSEEDIFNEVIPKG